ncbi:MAG: MerR family transcriptional regulator [Gemmatimonadales bacterium]
MTPAQTPSEDALSRLRAYRRLAPFGLHDLATISAAILRATGVRPISSAARHRPSERTIRFYVSQGLVAPPEGRGTAAVYTYRHLLQVLTIKLRQMEGATLSVISSELDETTGDVLERRVAATLGPSLPTPTSLTTSTRTRDTVGQQADGVIRAEDGDGDIPDLESTTWRRIPISPGLELHLDASKGLVRPDQDRELAAAIRTAVGTIADRSRYTG